MHRRALAILFVGAGLIAPSIAGSTTAVAQVPTVDPRGGISDPAAPPPAPAPPAPTPIIVNVPGAKGTTGTTAPATTGTGQGVYHLDEYQRRNGQWSARYHGPIPELHVVRRGDTLWDISWYYFSNPWEWPKIWSYNAAITNPHWIYPGDLVRLYAKGTYPTVSRRDPISVPTQPRVSTTSVSLRQLAFVDRDKLKYAAEVVGSVDAKALLSRGDMVYLRYPKNRPPRVGRRYAIYSPRKPIAHPALKENGKAKVVGAYVRILGELEVLSVKKGKRARAVIRESVDVIERGALVGPLQQTFKVVQPTPNARNLQAYVVGILETDQLSGQGQLIFIDAGSKQGLKVGNRLYVIRRGDAYDAVMKPGQNVGKDDRRFPARAIAEATVVQVGDNSAVCLLTASLKEAEVGDLILMRKSK